MPNSPAFHSVACAGAVAISASLFGFAALPQTSGPPIQTPAVALTSGETDIFVPDLALASTATEAAAAVPAESISFADLLSSVEASNSAGENLLGVAETAFTNGDYSVGLADALAGFNNLTVGAGSEVLLNGYAFLTGDGGNAALILDAVPRPSDLTAGLTEAQEFLVQSQSDFGTALTDLGAGHVYDSLVDLTAIATDSTNATDAIILGLFDSLPGVTISF